MATKMIHKVGTHCLRAGSLTASSEWSGSEVQLERELPYRIRWPEMASDSFLHRPGHLQSPGDQAEQEAGLASAGLPQGRMTTRLVVVVMLTRVLGLLNQ